MDEDEDYSIGAPVHDEDVRDEIEVPVNWWDSYQQFNSQAKNSRQGRRDIHDYAELLQRLQRETLAVFDKSWAAKQSEWRDLTEETDIDDPGSVQHLLGRVAGAKAYAERNRYSKDRQKLQRSMENRTLHYHLREFAQDSHGDGTPLSAGEGLPSEDSRPQSSQQSARPMLDTHRIKAWMTNEGFKNDELADQLERHHPRNLFASQQWCLSRHRRGQQTREQDGPRRRERFVRQVTSPEASPSLHLKLHPSVDHHHSSFQIDRARTLAAESDCAILVCMHIAPEQAGTGRVAAHSPERKGRVNIMLRPEDDQFLDRLSDEIYKANGCRVSRSEIIAAGITAVREIHRFQGRSAAFLPFSIAKNGSVLSMLVVVGIRGAVDVGAIEK